MTAYIWIGIVLCLSQSAMLSGLNLAYFSQSKLRLELEAEKQNKYALRVLALRKDSNFLLVTILWANVGVNVLLALLSGSVLTGILAFLFSTVVITILGEIIPQAYFSRHALRVASFFYPFIRIYQYVLFPIAKPTSLVLDKWLGKEAIPYFEEKDLRGLIKMHMESLDTNIEKMEGKGALNFLALDDLPMSAEGEDVDPKSIMQLPFEQNMPVFPEITASTADPFLKTVQRSGKKWMIITDEGKQPRMALNTDAFLRDALFKPYYFKPIRHCHKPIIVKDERMTLGQIIPRLKVDAKHIGDDVIDEDIILVWGNVKKIITGSDLLGRLLRGIVSK